MVMYRPPSSSSAALQSIRRELQRRRSNPLAPARSVGKKPSASPPPRHGSSNAVRDPRRRLPHREIPSSSPPIPEAPPSLQSRPRDSSRCVAAFPPPPPPRSVPSSAESSPLRPGTVVGVRTRTTTLKTGQVLVLWLKATVMSSTSHGGYEVVYDGSRPSGDLKGTVSVPRHHVRVIKTSPSAMTPPPPTATVGAAAAAAAAQKKEMLPAARPTTAGKSVRVIRRIILGH